MHENCHLSGDNTPAAAVYGLSLTKKYVRHVEGPRRNQFSAAFRNKRVYILFFF